MAWCHRAPSHYLSQHQPRCRYKLLIHICVHTFSAALLHMEILHILLSMIYYWMYCYIGIMYGIQAMIRSWYLMGQFTLHSGFEYTIMNMSIDKIHMTFKVIGMTSSGPYNFRAVKVNECHLIILGSLFIFQLIWLDPRICGCHAELVIGNIQISKIILCRHTNLNIWALCLEHILWSCLLVEVTGLHAWSNNIISMAFNCSNSSALAMQLLQSCTKPPIWGYLWNSTKYILPIYWKIWFLYNFENLRALTLNVWGPSYLGLTRSISWILMPWLLTSPGNQQPWYWLCRIGRFLLYLRKDFKYLHRINVEKWHKM